MANNIIQVKRTTVSGRQPNTTGSYATNSQYIAAGEFALNLTDGILYSSNGSAVIEVGANNTSAHITSSLTLDNNTQLRFKTINASAYSYFTQQSDDNFVFYSTDTAYNPRAIWAVYANSVSSNFKTLIPLEISSTIVAGSSNGSAGQVLTSNGNSPPYWSTVSGGGGGSVNTAAQYTWTNNHTFQANVSVTGSGIAVNSNTGSVYFGGITDANWRISRNAGITTKFFYTNNTLDIIAASSPKEGIVFGWTGNSYLEVGYAGTYTTLPIYVGNSSVNTTINSTSFTGTANNSSYLGGTAAASYVQNTDSRTLSGNLTFTGANLVVTGTNTYITSNVLIGSTASFYSINGQSNASGGNFIANAYATLSGAGGNYLAFGQQTNFSQWIQSGYPGAVATYYNIILNPLGGNVGIGNTTPTHRLSINGNTYISDTLTVGTATVNTTIYTGTANNTSFVGSVTAANVVSNAQLSSNLANYQTTAGLSANVATLTANNSTYLNGQLSSYYTNASNITTGTLPYAQLGVNVVNTSANFTISGVYTHNSNVALIGNSTSVFTVSTINATSNGVLVGNNIIQVGNSSIYSNLTPIALYTTTVNANVSGSYVSVTTANATTLNSGANLVVNSTSIVWTGNTTTSPTITFANTGSIVIGNGSVTAAPYINIANSAGNVYINTTAIFIGGNSIANSTGANNAFNLGGTAAASYQLNSTLGANIASYLPTYTGVVNAASYTVGTSFTANATVIAFPLGNVTSTTFNLASGTSFFPQLTVTNYTSDANGPYWNTQKSRANGAVVSGDTLGTFIFRGHDGTQYINSSYITSQVDGTVATNVIPTKMNFYTANATGNLNSVMFLAGNGNIGASNNSPIDKLSINGTTYFGGAISSAINLTANTLGVYHTGTVNAASLTVGTSFTANATVVNAVSYYAGTTLIGNTTGPYGKTESSLNVNSALTANNSTNLGGTAAASYQLNSTLNANIASYLPTYTGIVNASAFTTTGNANAANHYSGANAVFNSTSLSWTGNTTTSPSITLANTGVLTLGNSSVTAAPQITVANSLGTTTVNSNYISTTTVGANLTGSYVSVTTANATTFNGTTINANLAGSYVSVTTANATTFNGTTINANLAGSYVVVTTANATTFNSGANLYVNSTSITWTGNTTTSATIALANTGSLTIGNSTTTQTASIISVANSTGNVQITPGTTSIVATGTVNAASYNAGVSGTGTGGLIANVTTLFIGNNTINTSITSAGLVVNGAVTVNSTGLYTGSTTDTTTGIGATIANDSIIFIGNNTVNAFLNTTGLSVNGVTIANTLGVYTTGTVNATTISTGSVNVINASGLTTTANVNIGAAGELIVTAGAGLYANGVLGTAGQVLASNGSSIYWSTVSGGASLVANTTDTQSFYFPMANTTSGSWSNGVVTNTKLYFVPSTGTLSATIFNSLSDETQKTDIKTINNALDIVSNLRGVSFTWKETGESSTGVIAQEVEKILPELVTDKDGLKSVNYDGLIGILIESIKELKEEIKVLKNKKTK